MIPPLTVRCAALAGAAWLGTAQAPQATLPWGGDAEGGAPFVEADPADPSQVRGFDVEVAQTIARGLGRRARFVQVQWSSIDQSVERRDFAIGLSGVEDTPARRARHAVTIPYFEFREVLAVRPGDRGRWPDLQSTSSGTEQIWTMLADGTHVQQLTRQGRNTQPNWSNQWGHSLA